MSQCQIICARMSSNDSGVNRTSNFLSLWLLYLQNLWSWRQYYNAPSRSALSAFQQPYTYLPYNAKTFNGLEMPLYAKNVFIISLTRFLCLIFETAASLYHVLPAKIFVKHCTVSGNKRFIHKRRGTLSLREALLKYDIWRQQFSLLSWESNDHWN